MQFIINQLDDKSFIQALHSGDESEKRKEKKQRKAPLYRESAARALSTDTVSDRPAGDVPRQLPPRTTQLLHCTERPPPPICWIFLQYICAVQWTLNRERCAVRCSWVSERWWLPPLCRYAKVAFNALIQRATNVHASKCSAQFNISVQFDSIRIRLRVWNALFVHVHCIVFARVSEVCRVVPLLPCKCKYFV